MKKILFGICVLVLSTTTFEANSGIIGDTSGQIGVPVRVQVNVVDASSRLFIEGRTGSTFEDISPANRYFETSAEAVVELDNIIQKIEVSLSDDSPVLTLGSKDKDKEETLQSNLYIRSVSKSRIDSKKCEIDLIGRLTPITVAN